MDLELIIDPVGNWTLALVKRTKNGIALFYLVIIEMFVALFINGLWGS